MSFSSPPSSGHPALPSRLLAAVREQPIESPLRDWQQSYLDGFHDRVVAANYSIQTPFSFHAQPNMPASSPRSTSSMALSARSYTIAPSVASTRSAVYPPSLVNSSTSHPESSVGTSLASVVRGFPLLEEGHDGVLEQPSPDSHPIYECSFWFLQCAYRSDDEYEWRTHCLSHFRGQPPPKSVTCPLCDSFKGTYEDGFVAWTERMAHVARHHQAGYTLASSRPDFDLFAYLWQKRIIDAAQYKELKGGGQLSTYTITGGRTRDDRRERRQRRP